MSEAPARRGPGPSRLALIALIGLGLIAAPFAFQMITRAPKGATMISDFRPYMTAQRLDGFQRDLRQMDAGVRQSRTSVAVFLAGPPSGTAHARFDARFPEFAGFESQWRGIDADMSGMLDTIQGNLGNYRAVAALPSFTLFPWFFLVPGVIILGLLAGVVIEPAWWGAFRWALVALGAGLIAAPAVFQMFDRAPKGERMVSAFKTIETRKHVETIQGYFGEMALGQGAVRLEIIPALERSGLTRAQIAARFPAVDALDRQWVPILNDMTPMIGTMSDNVVNYDAVASLPPFGLFPWFFVIPGVLVAGLALVSGPRPHVAGSTATPVSPNADGVRTEGAP